MTAAERRWWWRTGRGVGNVSSDGGLIGAVMTEPDIELGFIRGAMRRSSKCRRVPGGGGRLEVGGGSRRRFERGWQEDGGQYRRRGKR
jgi:hypothetical protein